MRVAFLTLGCKVNQYETEILKIQFAKDGFDIVDSDDFADVYVINSCTVTASGDKKTRQLMNKMKKQNPASVIALTGCMPQAFPEKAEILEIPQVVTGSYNRASLLSHVKTALATGEKIIDITPHEKGEAFEKMQVDKFTEKTRAFVKIEDGCDRYCSYCIIPKARGPIRSKSLDDLKEEVITLVENGYKEFVLVGINLSSYGKGTDLRLIDAIELVCGIDGVQRVRLGSLEPELLLDEDIKRMSLQPKFCPQFHLSMQSGCDQTLKRMNRHYDTAFYYDLVTKLRNTFDDCSITTDIMVGFAGETEEEFNSTIEFVKKVGFAKAHIFAYSIREGTVAAKYTNQLDRKTKEARSKIMIATTEKSKLEFLQKHVGTTQEVLFESTQTEDGTEGYTKNYIPVFVKSDEVLSKQIHKVKIVAVKNDFCVGELV